MFQDKCSTYTYIVEINECATKNGGCQHTCTNTAGSFTCTCDDGFELVNSFGCSGK